MLTKAQFPDCKMPLENLELSCIPVDVWSSWVWTVVNHMYVMSFDFGSLFTFDCFTVLLGPPQPTCAADNCHAWWLWRSEDYHVAVSLGKQESREPIMHCNLSQIHCSCSISYQYSHQPMMTQSNGNIFRVTGHLCGEFTGHRWIPHTKASAAELWCFLWSAPESTVE